MTRKVTKWLQLKVIIGLTSLLLGAAAVFTYLNILAEQNHASQQLLSYVRQLDVQGQAIKQRATTYANHAPRDYGPYERDVIIFYPDFMRDLQAFDKQISHVASVASELPGDASAETNTAITSSINKLQTTWQNFRHGFNEKLGSNPQEPRLEWGADYVHENQDLINSITGSLILTIEQAIQQQLAANKQLSLTAITAAGSLLVLGVIWFYISVVRRIALTVKGCQRVAQGDFGYQLPAQRNDELGALAMAFNTLSARTRFVLNMLSKMHRHGSAENKIDALWNEAGDYLPISWLGLWHYNNTDNDLVLMSMRSDRPMRTNLQQALLSAASHDPHLLKLCKAGTPVKYDNLTETSTHLPDARLFHEVLKVGLLKSALVVPLASDDGWHGLLVFIASDSSAYSNEQVELMGNLAPFMAAGFAQSGK